MSDAARARRRRNARERPENEHGFGVMVGWCEAESQLAATRKQLHDKLIRMMGTRRTGAVRWEWCSGDEAMVKIEQFQTEPASDARNAPELLDYYRQLRGCLREYGGWLVVAMAPGRPANTL